MTKTMINEQYDVDDPNATKAFAKGEKREDYADAWKDTGNVVLVGLAGSGKAALAKSLSERTGAEVVIPDSVADASQLLGGEKRIIVLGDALVESPDVQPLIHGAGKVFYLIADSNTLATRVAERGQEEDREQLWRDLSARLAVMEPIFYSVLHFILQPQSHDEMVEDALEKIAF